MAMAAVIAMRAVRLPDDDQPCAPAGGERAVVARVRAGDPQAFRTLFDRWAPPVRRFLCRMLHNEAAADEATQECFVRAHRLIGGLRDENGFVGWLFGIARLVALEQRRALRRVSDASPPELPDPRPSPEALLLGWEGDRLLAQALATLEPERRAALLLRIDQGLGYEEIATAMGWSVAKVKNEIHRGRQTMRGQLAAYLGGQG
jgi:RNA polymerase sigma-70 factor (ECF subfamily)